MLIEHRPSHHN
jgi:hypothetical protein